ncbi:glycoside hydrolase family 13 protein [Diaminobutyricibacter sp. McL0608]|uniref:glycoside hydrolase family 13 protein n=1 Tax=Leifsonia sp. McL0608 TaxID=3143537 RepID=UPI0031F2F58D
MGVAEPTDWWRDAVIYQIYPRSFADSDGDGIGDLRGVAGHLGYLSELGIDALWFSPFYVSPQADAGYDVADYRDIDPLFGTLADFDALLANAHGRGLRVIVDLVPNHTSKEHAWFREAVAAEPGSAARERYLFRDGLGRHGELAPNNWTSVFGGSAWTQVDDGREAPQWYLHLFDPAQPDLNWRNPEVIAEFKDILRFWLDRGVDGFRIDVAHGLVKQAGLPDWHIKSAELEGGGNRGPMWDQDDVHDIYRGWNAVLAEYAGDRILVAEAWVAPAERLSRYVRSDEMQQAFNFDFMTVGWDPVGMKESIDRALTTNAAVGATTTWVLSNHDVVRHASRFGLKDATSWPRGIGAHEEQPDAALGLSRARAATLFVLALPGSAYIYEGEELGLPEHTTLPDDVRQDPSFARTGGAETGRDGARVPIPWVADAPAYGFSPTGATWLPQPPAFAALAADRQEGVEGSTLELYRAALRLRREHGLGRGALEWTGADAAHLSFANRGVRVLTNFGARPLPLPVGARILLASEPDAVVDGALAPDRTVWFAQ